MYATENFVTFGRVFCAFAMQPTASAKALFVFWLSVRCVRPDGSCYPDRAYLMNGLSNLFKTYM